MFEKENGDLIIKRNSFERNQDLILQIYEPLRKEKLEKKVKE